MLAVKVNRFPDLANAPESSVDLISRDGPPLAMLEFSTGPDIERTPEMKRRWPDYALASQIACLT